MTTDTRMTLRLTPAARRKVERFAARHGVSIDDALDRLILSAPDDGAMARARYRLRPRSVGFGFDIARARTLASDLADRNLLRKLTPPRQ